MLQLVLILVACKTLARLVARIGQPPVVGEMVTGIALGPTIFGSLAPDAYAAVFPTASLGSLSLVSQVGLVVFLFFVGSRAEASKGLGMSRATLWITVSSVLVPLIVGLLLGYLLFPRHGSGNVFVFALFVGTSLSVTALPVLARILAEKGLMGTRLGSISIMAAAGSGLAGWILLTLVSALSPQGATEWIGVNAFVGAFVAGLLVPKRWSEAVTPKIETFAATLPIPVYFALTGIRTNLLPRDGMFRWSDFTLILAVAVLSKWGGSMMGARIAGFSWRESNVIGVLMNTRGLVELVILNLGLERGLIGPPLFSAMVLMALVTTFMTAPLLNAIGIQDSQ